MLNMDLCLLVEKFDVYSLSFIHTTITKVQHECLFELHQDYDDVR